MASDQDPLIHGVGGKKRTDFQCLLTTGLVLTIGVLAALVILFGVLWGQERDANRELSNGNNPNNFGCQAEFSQVTAEQRKAGHASNRAHLSASWSLPAADPLAVVVLFGLPTEQLLNTDTQLEFRQESNFLYLSGIMQPGCALAYFVASQQWTLFVPRLEARYAVWSGYVLSLQEWQQQTGATLALYTDQFVDYFNNLTALYNASNTNWLVYTLNTTSAVRNDPLLTLPASVPLNKSLLEDQLAASRVVKTEYEIGLLRIASQVSAEAHRAVMGYVRSGLFEYNAEARFDEYTGSCALSYPSYLPIVGAGYSSAILHYIENESRMNRSDLLLIDAASSYLGYASDITRTYPVCGCYSDDQALVYNMVLAVQQQSIAKLAVGANFNTISSEARQLLLQQLLDHDFVSGNVTAMLAARCDLLFMNHGLGHFVGLDVHDPGAISAKANLAAGMVLTVEPGIYFNEALLQPALDTPTDPCHSFLVAATIDPYLQSRFGGVRIEDVVLIQPPPSNFEILSAAAPKSIPQVEHASGCRLKCNPQ